MAISELERRIQRLEDLEAIKRLKYRQMSALDRLDPDGIAQCYTPDAQWEGGTERREGRDVIQQRMAGNFVRSSWFFHVLVNPEIDVSDDGTRAAGSWKLLEWMITGGERQWMLGRFEDRYRKDNGEWLIEHSHWSREFQARVTDEVLGPA